MFLRRYVVKPLRVEVEVDGAEPVIGVSCFVQNATPYTFFKTRPVDLVDGVDLDSGDLGGAVLRRASPVDVPTIAWRALSKPARIERHRQVSAFRHAQRVVVRSRTTTGPCPCRSTATSSDCTRRPCSPCGPGALQRRRLVP